MASHFSRPKWKFGETGIGPRKTDSKLHSRMQIRVTKRRFKTPDFKNVLKEEERGFLFIWKERISVETLWWTLVEKNWVKLEAGFSSEVHCHRLASHGWLDEGLSKCFFGGFFIQWLGFEKFASAFNQTIKVPRLSWTNKTRPKSLLKLRHL